MTRALPTIAIVAALLAGAVSPADAYGALAVGRIQDGHVVIALITRPDAAAANRDATAVCERMARRRGQPMREPCRVVNAFENVCVATVTDVRNRFYTAEAAENATSRFRATDACTRDGGRSCAVVRSLCDRTTRRAVPAPAAN